MRSDVDRGNVRVDWEPPVSESAVDDRRMQPLRVSRRRIVSRVDQPCDFGGGREVTASGKRRYVMFALLGVAGLVLQSRYGGPFRRRFTRTAGTSRRRSPRSSWR